MKHYLELVRISARVHKKQNRMSIFCIVLSVLLVTVIFGMADMFLRSQKLQSYKTDGNWHAILRQISAKDAALIAARPDVEVISWYEVYNYRAEPDCSLGGKPVAISGFDESFLSEIFTGAPILEGHFPAGGQEALVTQNAREDMGLALGDTVTVQMPEGEPLPFTVCGFVESTPMMLNYDAYGISLSSGQYQAISQLASEDEDTQQNPGVYYVRFSSHSNIRKAIAQIRSQFQLSEDQVGQNARLLGILGQSDDPTILGLYLVAGVLVFLVLVAGVLMITSSLNSNVAQRTRFFGMLRCIGAGPGQVVRLVRAEALSWCRFAIPLGLGAGTVLIWCLCALLRWLSPYYFAQMPVFSVSVSSLLAGSAVGLLTVLLAARAPARRASRVSPLTAVSGNADAAAPARNAASTSFWKVDTALGIHHARADRKNLILMTGSFALSIILFLSFSLLIDFMNHALKPLSPAAPDLSVVSPDSTRSIHKDLLTSLQADPAVKRAYGRMFAYDVPAASGEQQGTVNVISYENSQFRWAKQSLLEGSLEEAEQSKGTALTAYRPDNPLRPGDVVTLDCNGTKRELKIVGLLADLAFDGKGFGSLVCSEDTFQDLFGEGGYTIIDLQVSRDITEKEVEAIHTLAGREVKFSDRRASNAEVTGAYLAFSLFVYGFLAMIALITVFHVVNSLSMSVSAKMGQYGAMRAIGMSGKQLIRMVSAEAAAYAVAGSLAGCGLGLPVHWFLFQKMIALRWGDPWRLPLIPLGITVLLVGATAFLAVRGPAGRIRNMSVVETVSAQ